MTSSFRRYLSWLPVRDLSRVFHVKQVIRRVIALAALLTITLFSSVFEPTTGNRAHLASAATTTRHGVPGVLLVTRRPGVTRQQLHALAGDLGVSSVARDVERLRVPVGQEETIASRLIASGEVDFAEPDYIRHVATVPNDPLYSQQWSLPRVNAPTAWQLALGSPAVKIAVIDTGFDLTHPDAPAYLVAGPTFTSTAAADGCGPEGTDGPLDDFGHGTHVGGIIAASYDNGVGVAGLAPAVSLLVIKAGDCTGNLADSDVLAAIDAAVSDGATVINMSFGGTDYSAALASAMAEAWNAGVVLVAAAGNDRSNTPFYPASYPNVVAVSATDQSDNLAIFSSYGPDVALAAPGVSILSTMAPFTPLAGDSNELYATLSGTSMAAPHVAAVAGLIDAAVCHLTNAQVVQALERGADPLGSPVPNQSFGYGRLDAAGALVAAGLSVPSPTAVPPPGLSFRMYFPLLPSQTRC
jgi:subtilisin family serine protease